MSVHALTTSITSPLPGAVSAPVSYDRLGGVQGDASRAATPARSNADAMRVELTPQARLAASRSAVTNATAEAASSADFFASADGLSLLGSLGLGSARVDHRA